MWYGAAMPKSIPKKAYASVGTSIAPIAVTPIGRIHSPHRERFGTPHQAILQADAQQRPQERAQVELFADHVPEETLADLAGFDYVWIIAWLHLNQGFRAKVAPPRDPDHPRGLFATRAPHRPNPIGLSAARVLEVHGHVVELERVDLLDGTPVLDLKPYVPYADAFPNAKAGWLDALPTPRN